MFAIIKSIAMDNKRWMVFIFFAMAYTAMAPIFSAWFTAYVLDSIAGHNVDVTRIIVLGIINLFWLATMQMLRNFSRNMFAKKINFTVNKLFINSLLAQPARKLDAIGEGRLLTNFSGELGTISDLIFYVLDIIRIIFEMVITLAFLVYINVYFAIVVAVLLPPVTVAAKWAGDKFRRYSRKYLASNDRQLGMLKRIFKAVNVIKAYSAEKYVEEDFNNISTDKYNLDKLQVGYDSIFSGIRDLLMGLPFFILYSIGGMFYQTLNITVGTLMEFLMLLNRITVPFTDLNRVIINYKTTKVSIERLNDILIVRDDQVPQGEKKVIGGPIRSIQFTNIGFKYQDRFVVGQLNLSFESGGYYAIIGENGSGKTTFMKLLLNIFTPDTGDIFINNTSIKELAFDDIRKNNKLVYVENDPAAIFDGFSRNITIDHEKDERLFLESLAKVGLDGNNEELYRKNADELSAGQKQRASLARAFYHLRNGTVLVMDEPFSALDANGAKAIHKALSDYQKKHNLTIVEITHNLVNMERFNHIYFFEDGKVVLEGNHERLMNYEKYRLYMRNFAAHC